MPRQAKRAQSAPSKDLGPVCLREPPLPARPRKRGKRNRCKTRAPCPLPVAVVCPNPPRATETSPHNAAMAQVQPTPIPATRERHNGETGLPPNDSATAIVQRPSEPTNKATGPAERLREKQPRCKSAA